MQTSIEKLLAGNPQRPKKRRKVVDLHDRIKKVIDDYDNRTLEEFLKGIVFNVQFS